MLAAPCFCVFAAGLSAALAAPQALGIEGTFLRGFPKCPLARENRGFANTGPRAVQHCAARAHQLSRKSAQKAKPPQAMRGFAGATMKRDYFDEGAMAGVLEVSPAFRVLLGALDLRALVFRPRSCPWCPHLGSAPCSACWRCPARPGSSWRLCSWWLSPWCPRFRPSGRRPGSAASTDWNSFERRQGTVLMATTAAASVSVLENMFHSLVLRAGVALRRLNAGGNSKFRRAP